MPTESRVTVVVVASPGAVVNVQPDQSGAVGATTAQSRARQEVKTEADVSLPTR